MSKKSDFRRRQKLAAETREVLVARFPKTFFPKKVAKRPLKLGIYNDIKAAAPEIRSEALGAALYDYCRGWTYLDHVVEGEARLDLDGEPAGVVTADEANAAARGARGSRAAAHLESKHRNLLNAVRAVYYAAHWSPDRPCNADELWTALRDTAGFEPGQSTRVLHPAPAEAA